MGEWQKNLTKENSKGWKGGLTLNIKAYRIMAQGKRRAMKNSSFGIITIAEWEDLKQKYKYRCLSCGKYEPEISLTQDHIIPLSRGGGNTIDNIQPLCKSCNSKKYTDIVDFRVEIYAEDNLSASTKG